MSNCYGIHKFKKWTKTKLNLEFFGAKMALICLNFSSIVILLPSSANTPIQLGWVDNLRYKEDLKCEDDIKYKGNLNYENDLKYRINFEYKDKLK